MFCTTELAHTNPEMPRCTPPNLVCFKRPTRLVWLMLLLGTFPSAWYGYHEYLLDANQWVQLVFMCGVGAWTAVALTGTYPELLFMTQKRPFTWEDVERVPAAKKPAVIVSFTALLLSMCALSVYFFVSYWDERASWPVLLGSVWSLLNMLQVVLGVIQKWTVRIVAWRHSIRPGTSMREDAGKFAEMSLLRRASVSSTGSTGLGPGSSLRGSRSLNGLSSHSPARTEDIYVGVQ